MLHNRTILIVLLFVILATLNTQSVLAGKVLQNGDELSATLVFKSIGSHDGWVLESSETSNKGGTKNSTASTLNMGDDARDRMYRVILSFNTASIPDNAVITSAKLRLCKAGLVGTNPFNNLYDLKINIKKGSFGTSPGLEISDFQAYPSKCCVGAFGKTPVNNWYTAALDKDAYPYVNKACSTPMNCLTQFEVNFYLDDDDDLHADYLKYYSGDAASNVRPQLIIQYNTP